MAKRIYLHIGTHKTGTTAIQFFFAANADKIPNYFYPRGGRMKGNPTMKGDPSGHHMLSHSVLGKVKTAKGPDAVWRELIQEIDSSPADNVVLSSEVFDGLGPAEIGRVRRYLSGYPVTVVVYLRRQDELIQAHYSTQVKTGNMSLPFDDYLKRHRENWDYYVFLKNWAEEFGKENIRVRVYSKDRLIEGDSIRDFCAQIGVPSLNGLIFPERRLNPGLTRNAVEILRLMNSLELPKESLAEVVRIARSVYPAHKFYDIMSPGDAKRLVESFKSSNDKVLHEYLGDAYESLFPDSSDDISEERWRELYDVPNGNIRKTIADLKEFVLSCRSRRLK